MVEPGLDPWFYFWPWLITISFYKFNFIESMGSKNVYFLKPMKMWIEDYIKKN